jgi:DNA-binding SARP family transcriptional activator/predicted ATPase/Tfp pilus assembly protein PilF
MQPYVRLFGSPEVELRGKTACLSAERRFQLLAVLALRRGPVPRDWLAGLFWPDRDNATARRNLRKLAFDAQELDWATGVDGNRSTLAWRVPTDVDAFDGALAAGRLEEALKLYRGPLLDGLDDPRNDAFEEFLRHERARRAEQWHSAALVQLGELAGDPQAVQKLATAMLEADPLDEDAIAALLNAYQALDRAPDALRTYRSFKERLANALGIEPSARLRELARKFDAGTAPSVRSAAALQNFVGRMAELKEVRVLLARPECRVLTITGPGGSGKSRLARAVASVPEGDLSVHWIALEDLGDTSQVVPRIAEAVGIQLDGRRDPVSDLVGRLRTRAALLVLDNSEHLSGLDGLVERIAAECAGVKFLNTSRTRLGTTGEWLMPLDGLALPDEDESDVEVLRAFDSVRLFESRALAAAPGFSLREHAPDVRRLVHLVGGLPLALELAAAWTRMLPVREILAEISRSSELLEGGARERSMRASLEHSWKLLAPAERDALAALSVFNASFSRAAAMAVASARLPLLAALVDKSMLRAHGDGRFSLHFLIRQFAVARVDAPDDLRRKHADYFARKLAGFADSAQVRQQEVTAELRIELADCTAAWEYALSCGNASWVLQMAAPLWDFFDREGRWEEAASMLQAAFQALDEAVPGHRPAIADVARRMSALQIRRGRYEAAEQWARRALRLARALGDRATIRAALHAIGGCRAQVGDMTHARVYFEDSLRRARADRSNADIASYSNGLATIEKAQGNYERALELYEESLALKRQLGEMRGVAVALHNIGNLHRGREEFAQASRYLEEALQVCEENGLLSVRSSCLANLGMTRLQLGDLDRAAHYYARALADVRNSGERLTEIFVLLGMTRIATLKADLPRARQTLREALALACAESTLPLQLECAIAFAELLAKCGDPMRAATICRFARDHPALNAQDRQVADRLERSFGLDAAQARKAESNAVRIDLCALMSEIRRELDPGESVARVTLASLSG